MNARVLCVGGWGWGVIYHLLQQVQYRGDVETFANHLPNKNAVDVSTWATPVVDVGNITMTSPSLKLILTRCLRFARAGGRVKAVSFTYNRRVTVSRHCQVTCPASRYPLMRTETVGFSTLRDKRPTGKIGRGLSDGESTHSEAGEALDAHLVLEFLVPVRGAVHLTVHWGNSRTRNIERPHRETQRGAERHCCISNSRGIGWTKVVGLLCTRTYVR